MNNPSIIEEIRHYREEHARKFDFDIARIVEDAQQVEGKLRNEGWNVVTLKAAKRKTANLSTCHEISGEYSTEPNVGQDEPV